MDFYNTFDNRESLEEDYLNPNLPEIQRQIDLYFSENRASRFTKGIDPITLINSGNRKNKYDSIERQDESSANLPCERIYEYTMTPTFKKINSETREFRFSILS